MRTTGSRSARPLVAALLVASTGLAACSPSSTGRYCDALASAQVEWKDAGTSLADPAAATRFLRTVTSIEQEAPDEVRQDWQALHTLFAKFTVANPDLGALTQQLEGFESSAKRIETHARETCGVDLGS
ncbi:hypothetical protein [Terrabacter sp. 2RAF25]|uniref:hypothetical protein n=1 Tax=Terrabacter sp. 2RAF25 TaxID=3232998 RepID=UPI003F9E0652